MCFLKWHIEFGKFSLEHYRKPQNWDFDGIRLSKVENVWAQNLQGSYVSWKWRMMQNLKTNWLVSLKLTWGIWPVLTRALKISKICSLMGCFSLKYIMFELKKCRGVMYDSTEDWWKLWRKTDLCFQRWYEEFDKFSFPGWKIAISF